jgi:2-amino-4-hydroxy-6-hydroxymethyldihydropteridine diphosphokinase
MGIYLGLGSNLGDRMENLRQALENFSVLQQSSFYETEPVDFLEQPWFVNAAVNINTNLPPNDLLDYCLEIEKKLGRVRDVPKGPRLIDIDILFYEQIILSTSSLILPHPQVPYRRFVLKPLNEIASSFVHPVMERTISDLLLQCTDESTVRKL